MKAFYAYCGGCGHEFLESGIDFSIGVKTPNGSYLVCPDCGGETISEYDEFENKAAERRGVNDDIRTG